MTDIKIIGFNFNKINVEKFSGNFKDLKIERNIKIESVEPLQSKTIQMKEEMVEIKFNYSINYSPKVAKFDFSGAVLITCDSKVLKEFLKEWKDKKLIEKHKLVLFNIIMRKSDIKALALEDEIGLPLHINLPLIREDK